MRTFERSWQHRLDRGKSILPQIRDQGQKSICAVFAAAGAIESAYKKVYAQINQDFESEISTDYLISKFKGIPALTDILTFIQSEGALTVDSYQQYLSQDPDKLIDHTDLELVKIKTFVPLQPQHYPEDFVELMVHVLSAGVAIGVFLATPSYNDKTVYYEDVGDPLFFDSLNEVGGDEESDVETNDEEEWKDEDDVELEDVDLEDNVELEDDAEKKDDAEKNDDAEEKVDYWVYHAVLLISLGMDEDNNLFWRILDSHGPDSGESGTRQIAVNLIKDAYIIEPNT